MCSVGTEVSLDLERIGQESEVTMPMKFLAYLLDDIEYIVISREMSGCISITKGRTTEMWRSRRDASKPLKIALLFQIKSIRSSGPRLIPAMFLPQERLLLEYNHRNGWMYALEKHVPSEIRVQLVSPAPLIGYEWK
jgi:hypothetical protein